MTYPHKRGLDKVKRAVTIEIAACRQEKVLLGSEPVQPGRFHHRWPRKTSALVLKSTIAKSCLPSPFTSSILMPLPLIPMLLAVWKVPLPLPSGTQVFS